MRKSTRLERGQSGDASFLYGVGAISRIGVDKLPRNQVGPGRGRRCDARERRGPGLPSGAVPGSVLRRLADTREARADPARMSEPGSAGVEARMLQGFNSDAEYAGRVFHVQTEDGGLDRPRVITHLFLRGAVVTMARSDYVDDLGKPDLATRIRKRMEGQHQAMLDALLRGDWDARIQACDSCV